MTRNHTILAQIDDKVIRDVPVDQIEMLFEELAMLKSAVARYSSILSAEMSRRFSDQAQAERRLQCKDTGTVRMTHGDHVIVADLPKEVDWHQKGLAATFNEISEKWEGEDPTDYINVKYSVDERKFTAWPKSLQKTFECSRTVKTGKATFKIEAKKEAA